MATQTSTAVQSGGDSVGESELSQSQSTYSTSTAGSQEVGTRARMPLQPVSSLLLDGVDEASSNEVFTTPISPLPIANHIHEIVQLCEDGRIPEEQRKRDIEGVIRTNLIQEHVLVRPVAHMSATTHLMRFSAAVTAAARQGTSIHMAYSERAMVAMRGLWNGKDISGRRDYTSSHGDRVIVCCKGEL